MICRWRRMEKEHDIVDSARSDFKPASHPDCVHQVWWSEHCMQQVGVRTATERDRGAPHLSE